MNVIITGASRGIGYALTKKLSQEKRMKLFVISRNEGKLQLLRKECIEINPDVEIQIIPLDLSQLSGNLLFNYIGSEHIDVLINNAGTLINKSFIDLKEAEIKKMADINFIVPARLISMLSSRMGGIRPTHVVNIGSMGGFQGSVKFPGLSIYSASKAALACLTECLAVEYKDKNVFFNYLALGAVQTEMLDEAFPGYKAPFTAESMAEYIVHFALEGYKYFNGKIIPVSTSTP